MQKLITAQHRKNIDVHGFIELLSLIENPIIQ